VLVTQGGGLVGRVFAANTTGDGNNGANFLAGAINEFNGGSFDRRRNNTEGTLLASAARTATTSSPDQVNYNGSGVIVYLNITANPGGVETLTLEIDAKVAGSGTTSRSRRCGRDAGDNGQFAYIPLTRSRPRRSACAARRPAPVVPLPRTWRATVYAFGGGQLDLQRRFRNDL